MRSGMKKSMKTWTITIAAILVLLGAPGWFYFQANFVTAQQSANEILSILDKDSEFGDQLAGFDLNLGRVAYITRPIAATKPWLDLIMELRDFSVGKIKPWEQIKIVFPQFSLVEHGIVMSLYAVDKVDSFDDMQSRFRDAYRDFKAGGEALRLEKATWSQIDQMIDSAVIMIPIMTNYGEKVEYLRATSNTANSQLLVARRILDMETINRIPYSNLVLDPSRTALDSVLEVTGKIESDFEKFEGKVDIDTATLNAIANVDGNRRRLFYK
ncbi:MAG: hypothetical protein K0A93_12700 [Desulfuromonadaceae bacterium]|nr:hypothetical protein [Desulfuromonadaceae bacterium]